MKTLTEYVQERGLTPAEQALKRKATNKMFAQNAMKGVKGVSKTAAAVSYAFKILDDLITV